MLVMPDIAFVLVRRLRYFDFRRELLPHFVCRWRSTAYDIRRFPSQDVLPPNVTIVFHPLLCISVHGIRDRDVLL